MEIPLGVLEEIRKHDLNNFKRLDASSYGVFMALEYFDASGHKAMAARLRGLIENGKLLIGPLEGFVAAAVSLPEGDFMLLSDFYPEYTTAIETVASLAGEIGFFDDFKYSAQENELHSLSAATWMKAFISKPSGISIISKAIKKIQKED